MRTRLRAFVVLQLAGVAALSAAAVLALGLPLLAGRTPGAVALGVLVLAQAALAVVIGAAALGRGLVAPLERLLGAAERLGRGGEIPALAPPGEGGGGEPSRAAVAFERVAGALEEERARLAAKVEELERVNRMLNVAREQLQRSERLAAVGQLAAGIAHEVGNPLGAVVGYAELARARLGGLEGEAPVAALEYVTRIAAEARRIDVIVRDLLEFARPAVQVTAAVDLPVVIDAAVRLARVQPRCRELQVRVEVAPGLPAIRGDEGRLVQVFLNLLLNAGDAMGGGGEVRVRAGLAEGRVVVEVADRGPGITPEHLPHVFDPFFTTKPPGAGSGLGLSVCHALLEAMGGTIAAGNGPEGGAVFRIGLAPHGSPAAG